jgi:hypothetical protein
MARYKAINPKFAEDWEDEYKRSSPVDQVGEKAEPQEELEEAVEETKTSRIRKMPAAKAATTEETAIKTSTREKKTQ